MSEPITAAMVVALGAGQFVMTELAKGVAGEGGKKLGEALWTKLKSRFAGDDRATEAIVAVEAEKSQESVEDLTTYVKSEMKRSPDFAMEVQQMAQKILNLDQSQTQNQTGIDVVVRDNSTANTVGTLHNSGTGDVTFGDKVAGNKYI